MPLRTDVREYNFHASANAYATFWNDAYFETQNTESEKNITRRHIWQAFVQESIRSVAISKENLHLPDGLKISEVVEGAFKKLGENGIIRAANHHSCPECIQPYKSRAEIITGDDPAAMVGMDEGQAVDVLAVEKENERNLATAAAVRAREYAAQMRNETYDVEMEEIDAGSVSMIVMDGIVMGPTVSNIVVFTENITNILI